MIRHLVAGSIAVLATTGVACAHDYGSRIDAREAAQARRIAEGRRSGELTWFEKFKLNREQAHIRQMERRAERDGVVTRGEARRIERAQDRASRDIYRETHDGQVSWRRWY
jgi:hypothetical protein